ncbi:NnrU family protein [Pontibaca sp. S1109L]|uniref:NnrU family protein n=2 Tax=Pontibaca salina TaxID=2795731 RepID=A0A934HPN7_9RHOB|nr:NnrU family protein [Pontibaca salina]
MLTGWGLFMAALAVFLASHVIPVRPPMRLWLIARLGLRGYYIGYSLFSVLVLVWLIVAAGRAPYVQVLPSGPVWRWVPLLIMPVAIALVVAGAGGVNPLSFGAMGRRPFDPDDPGVLAVTRHPMLLALLLWSLAHLLANGDLAHVILFGLFAVFAFLGMVVIDRRRRRLLGPKVWQVLARKTAWLSLSGLVALRPSFAAMVLTAAIYVGLLLLHLPVIGVSPLP